MKHKNPLMKGKERRERYMITMEPSLYAKIAKYADSKHISNPDAVAELVVLGLESVKVEYVA